MDLNQKELFEKLLQQLQLDNHPDYRDYLKDGKLDSVVVYKQSKRWEFILSFPDILPFEVYQALEIRLKESFQSIAQTELNIVSKEPRLTAGHLENYWKKAIQISRANSPLCKDLAEKQLPQLKDGQVFVGVENNIIQEQAEENFFPKIEKAYQQMGFPHFKIRAVIDEELSHSNKEAFEERQASLDEINTKIAAESLESRKQKQNQRAVEVGRVTLGRKISENEEITRMIDIAEEERQICIEGYVFDHEIVNLRSGRKLLQVKITDYSSSFTVKMFSNNEEDEAVFERISEGMWLRARGSIQEDTFVRDLVMMARDISEWPHEEREDTFPEGEKRIELHLHTNMSQLDGINGVSDYIAQAAKWGHSALALTDHAAVQAFPEAMYASQAKEIKMLYGMEAYVVNDGVPVAYNLADIDLAEAEFVAFDVETTGLSAVYDSIIELSGVRTFKGNVIDTFEEFIDPGFPIPEEITNLTGITDEMVSGSKPEEEVIRNFKEFVEGAILVAHNANFDIGFLNRAYQKYEMEKNSRPVIDTLELSRFLHPEFKSHRLNTLAKRYDVLLEQHHRAIYDAETTGNLCHIFLKEAEENYEIKNLNQLNDYVGQGESYKQARPYHVTVLCQNETGLKNLFKLVSTSNIDYLYRTPRIPRSVLEKYREGLLLGTACSQNEVFEALLQTGYEKARDLAGFYDYIEVQPKEAYLSEVNHGRIKSLKAVQDVQKNLVKIGEELDLPVVATGNVHYLHEEGQVYRDILIETQMASEIGREHSKLHFLTTDEMMEAFDFLGEEKAYEIVVANTHKIADAIEPIKPLKEDLYTPNIEGSNEEIRNMTYERAHEIYGGDLPELVEARIEKELSSIIGNGFSVIYLISQKLVEKSEEDGYIVGSRGSVGSSLVATFTGITEVNPLPPHYVCPDCQYSEFIDDDSIKSGFDLEDKDCPDCGSQLDKDGQNIPFETFLGFTGDKVPDIDLNFSGEYQAEAHRYTKVLFGEDYVYRAGTISTIKDKTAFGYVKAHEREAGLHHRSAEVDRLTKGLVGVKRSTGQHPGGIVVIPGDMDVYDFTPIQYPADDKESEWKTTHFDFHSIEDNILKLDILGHDDPTHLKMLEDLTDIDPRDIPLDDKEVMKIFSETEVLGVSSEQLNTNVGTLGVPEFGTPFVRQMLEQTHPSTFGELQQISGLSHGTDVYLGNAEVLIREHDMALADVIGCRDDIMNDLINYGLEDALAFKIMEHVRKGRGIPDDWQAEMRAKEVPEWYIQSCLKIKYMFPKAHATAYIIMALRVAYFKVHMPIYFYASYFSVRARDFDLQAMCKGKEAVKAAIKEINHKGHDATNKEKMTLIELEIANEMLERGFHFKMVDLERSDAKNFLIDEDEKTLIAPFRAVPALGEKAAEQVVRARAEQPFLSKEDLAKRGGVSKTVIEYLDANNVLKGLPDENQLSLFDSL